MKRLILFALVSLALFGTFGTANAVSAGYCATYKYDLVSYPKQVATVNPGQKLDWGWKMANCNGTPTWSGVTAVRISGSFGPSPLSVPTTKAGQTADIWARGVTAPNTPGTYKVIYQLQGSQGRFGDKFWMDIVVKGPPTINSLGCPDSVQVGKSFTCNPSTSGDISARSWSAGGASPSGGTGPTFSASYSTTGSKTVVFTACNGSPCASKSQTVTVTSAATSASLNVPYITQLQSSIYVDARGKITNNNALTGRENCGPASIAMVIRFYGRSTSLDEAAQQMRGYPNQPYVGPGSGTTKYPRNYPTDFQDTRTQSYLSSKSLKEIALGYGDYDAIKSQLGQGHPVVVLINNGAIVKDGKPYPLSGGWAPVAHVVVVTGYNGGSYTINDPLAFDGRGASEAIGKNFAVSEAAFKSAVTGYGWKASAIVPK